MKTYAIGDVHGRADLMAATLGYIESENAAAPDFYRLIFLGDIIDRGPDSRQAIDLVVAELNCRPEASSYWATTRNFFYCFSIGRTSVILFSITG